MTGELSKTRVQVVYAIRMSTHMLTCTFVECSCSHSTAKSTGTAHDLNILTLSTIWLQVYRVMIRNFGVMRVCEQLLLGLHLFKTVRFGECIFNKERLVKLQNSGPTVLPAADNGI